MHVFTKLEFGEYVFLLLSRKIEISYKVKNSRPALAKLTTIFYSFWSCAGAGEVQSPSGCLVKYIIVNISICVKCQSFTVDISHTQRTAAPSELHFTPNRRTHAHSSRWRAPVPHCVLRLLMWAAVTSSTRTQEREYASYMQAWRCLFPFLSTVWTVTRA